MSRSEEILRFGVLCRGTSFEAWQALCLEELLEEEGVELVLLVLDERGRTPDEGPASPSLAMRLSKELTRRGTLFRLWRGRLDRPRAWENRDLSEALRDVDKLVCRVDKPDRYSEHFRSSDLEALRNYDLDFLLRFGFGILRGEVLEVPEYGIWSFHHGDEKAYRGGPPAFWEIVEESPVTGAVLQRLTERLDGGIVLQKGWYPTRFRSYAANLDQVLFGSASWPARVCRDLRLGEADYLSASPSTTEAPVYTMPGAADTLRAIGRMAAARLDAVARRLFRHEDWNVALARRPIHSFLEDGCPSSLDWMDKGDRNRFAADPFAVSVAGRTHLLCEVLDYCDPRGRIATSLVPEDGGPEWPADCLTTDGHLSYPFTFQHEGETYCVPESSELRRVDLYRAVDPPGGWCHEVTLVEDVAAVDPTVFRHAGRWWMAYTDADEGSTVELYLRYATRLRGTWHSHPSNPVKTDVRSARPGGTPFVHEGELFRPAQDCSRENGGRILIQRVTRLSPEAFNEETAAIVEPDAGGPYPDGLHTLSAAGGVTLLDGKRLRLSPCRLRRELIGWVDHLRRVAGAARSNRWERLSGRRRGPEAGTMGGT